MSNKFTAKAAIAINATPDKVWEALTDPDMIREYLFGTNTITDWQKGSPITYKGEWKGQPYEDKGTIVDIVPEKRLHTTYFSGMSGKEDIPENYANVIYEISEQQGKTVLTITQDNNADEASRKHSEENWNTVLEGLKQLVEA
ncbi:SRPBCC domain-containing protein [Chitinophaga sedimenti]|uniref:SRPBCC family protein n=1 Tax=Chitinophaga sedimenti TaxID=2033606 RepID=UPI002004E980|nr:SRPBCC family protein [Chitinophaga sedimenti]MCK7555367.1 SRPBCC domain-containing protein [Chitinophaga sedimenti]